MITGNTAASGGGIHCSYVDAVITSNTITGNGLPGDDARNGGGIHCVNSVVTIAGNTISANSAGSVGGGVFCFGCTETITQNTISGNSAAIGGGIAASGTITNNTIANNVASSSGGGISNSISGTATITGNTIIGNSGIHLRRRNRVPRRHGHEQYHQRQCGLIRGGVYCINISPTTLSNNRITGNTATTTNGDAYGGEYTGGSRIDNNVIAGNTATLGGGIYGGDRIDNNMIAGNTASSFGGGIYSWSGKVVGNTIVGNIAQMAREELRYWACPWSPIRSLLSTPLAFSGRILQVRLH